MILKRSLVVVGALLVALPISGAELWVAPAIDPPDTEVGDWAVTGSGRAHFSFALPDDMVAISTAKVVVIGKNNKATAAEVYLSVAQNGLRHDDYTDSLIVDPVTCVANELVEVDVTSIFPNPLWPGEDYVSLYFSTKFARVIGLRFVYEADTALQSALDAEEGARVAADATLQNNLDAEAAARANADTGLSTSVAAEATIRAAVDADLQAQINAIGSGSPSLPGYEQVSETGEFPAGYARGSSWCLRAECTPGKRVLGGGIRVAGLTDMVEDSRVSVSRPYPSTVGSWWGCVTFVGSPASVAGLNVEVWAVCADY